ncbi:MAG TPA: DUF2231 domain-containing protein [Herpetosiphonaceae bacterium]
MTYLHPATVHFPLALLLAGSLIELLARPESPWRASAGHMLLLGWWGAVAAALAGMLDAGLRWERTQELLGWVNGHGLAGLAIVAVYWRLTLGRRQSEPARRRWLAAGVGLLLLTGWLGGHLVYGLGWAER